MKIYKILGILAVVFWLSIAIMAYGNVWLSDKQLIEAAHAENHTSYHWDTDALIPSVYTENVPDQYADLFPHEQVVTTMWITVIPAIVFSVLFVIFFGCSKNAIENTSNREAKTE
jgi:hypothetical protein